MVKCDLFQKSFFFQLFDIGSSAGSLFNEVLGIFRTFQRFSAAQSFSTRYSDQCRKMFEWAKNIYSSLMSFIEMDPLTDFEFFYIYTFAFPLMMLVFISAVLSNYNIILYFFVYGLFLVHGIGIGYIGVNTAIAVSLIIISTIMLIVGIVFRRRIFFSCFQILDNFTLFCNKGKDKEENGCWDCSHLFQFSFSVFAAFAIFSLIMIPILSSRSKLSLYLIIFTGPIFIICLIIETIVLCFMKSKPQINYTKIIGKCINFIINCFTLLIIPSTEFFVKIMQESYKNSWNCIISYVGLGLLLPIALIFLMIRNNVSDIQEKYNTSKFKFFNYYYIEIIDVSKQVAYALFAAYDVFYGCILLEVAWVALIFALLPYPNISDYSLSVGNSVIMFVSNGAMIYADLNEGSIISFAVTIIFVILSCIPAISSLYIYFIFDFEVKNEKPSENLDDLDDSNNQLDQSEKKNGFDKTTYNMANGIKALTPIAWFFYGLSVSLISKDIKL